jgi:hypothetical protein
MYLTHGILWSEAETLAKPIHRHYLLEDNWEATIRSWLDTDDGFNGKPVDREFLTGHDILQHALGLQTQQRNIQAQHRVGRILRKFGYVKNNIRLDGHQTKVWVKGYPKWEM